MARNGPFANNENQAPLQRGARWRGLHQGTSPIAGYSLVDFVASTPYTLAANTQYWVVMNYNGLRTDYAGWEATAGNSVTGVTGWNIPTGNDIFTPVFAVEGTPVPEPSTLALAGLGVGSRLAIRRR